jgi:FkbM family methyltransferase
MALARGALEYLYYNYLESRALVWRISGGATLKLGAYHARFTLKGSTRYLADAHRLVRKERAFELLFFLHELSDGDLFVDVGAFIGLHAIFAAKIVGVSGHVVAYEPDPIAREILSVNVRRNHLERSIEVRGEAVAERYGVSKLDEKIPLGFSNTMLTDNPLSQGQTVRTVTLDGELRGSAARLVKIDVEGYEPEVLAGGHTTFQDPSTTILLEIHSRILTDRGLPPRDFFRSLFTFGKPVYLLTEFVEGKRRECSPDERVWGEQGSEWQDNHVVLYRRI